MSPGKVSHYYYHCVGIRYMPFSWHNSSGTPGSSGAGSPCVQEIPEKIHEPFIAVAQSILFLFPSTS